MHVISRKALADFWAVHEAARGPLQNWYKIVSDAQYADFDDVRKTFNSADLVKGFVVFNANSYRIVTAIHFNRGKLYIRHVFTHAAYDGWTRRMRKFR